MFFVGRFSGKRYSLKDALKKKKTCVRGCTCTYMLVICFEFNFGWIHVLHGSSHFGQAV